MNRSAYRAVIFDLFGTLIPNLFAAEYREVTDAMAAAVGAPAGDFARLIGSGTWALRATGALATTEAAIEHVCRSLGLEPDPARVAEATRIRVELTRRTLRPLPGVVQTLAALRARGYRLGLISDCSAEAPLLWPETELARHIEAPVFSCVVGVKKPDPRIYTLACERLGVRPAECLYVGDGSGHELSGASAVGLCPVLVRVQYADTTDTDRPEIEAWTGLSVGAIPDVLALVA